ncbi:MAG: tRNA preQ1(34) S-adenosylmethionine ribosyltransferase-isomerase QueA [Endomicrobia bacterium]|nr:tRNA preQ1(34) S-adenosylmethionine ribosyltransferase-isomerase QueA [Endomicrobiia bacterium]
MIENKNFLISSYDFVLPKELIAQSPAEKRELSRLFFYNRATNEIKHLIFSDIVDIIDESYCIVLNDTKVENRKIECKKPTGGVLFILITEFKDNQLKALCYKKLNRNINKLILPNGVEIKVIGKDETTSEFIFETTLKAFELKELINLYGLPPLPPYIKRKLSDPLYELDKIRYQTVFAKNPASLAAPTAGFHFTKDILDKLTKKGIKILYITLNVGLSTFKPIKSKDLRQHKLIPENVFVSKNTAELLSFHLSKGGKVLCVGTTTVRTLEFLASKFGKVVSYSGPADIYIYPGYNFKIANGLITNFHLPRSSNLVLVSSFINREKILELYKIAVENRYRFYSYGDAMLIL